MGSIAPKVIPKATKWTGMRQVPAPTITVTAAAASRVATTYTLIPPIALGQVGACVAAREAEEAGGCRPHGHGADREACLLEHGDPVEEDRLECSERQGHGSGEEEEAGIPEEPPPGVASDGACSWLPGMPRGRTRASTTPASSITPASTKVVSRHPTAGDEAFGAREEQRAGQSSDQREDGQCPGPVACGRTTGRRR